MKTQFSSFLCSDIVTRCHLHFEVFLLMCQKGQLGKKSRPRSSRIVTKFLCKSRSIYKQTLQELLVSMLQDRIF